jgi:hypothetical protein
MAMIGKQAPPAPDTVAPARRVVVKLRRVPQGTAALEALGLDATLQNLAESLPGASVRPYFEEARLPSTTTSDLAVATLGKESVFQSFAVIEAPAGTDPAELARNVGKRADVEIAYVEGGPTPPPVSPNNNPLANKQGYLVPAPAGIDALWAWSVADGTGVGFVDIERGWTLDHEDLAAANISIISGLNQDFTGHGTAVLGEVVGVDNHLGIVGIAPAATTRVVSQWRTAGDYLTADAIRDAIRFMHTGDVLLLEAQTTYSTSAGYLPVEVEEVVFEAIRAATDGGIIVIEAGGNGSIDLDTFQNTNGRQILNRNSADYRDSGAIMVGASSSSVPHGRLPFSNFGSRIDCYAWGENIQTTGDGWTGNARNTYTPDFGGTSGASPIVTGAAIVLQSWARARKFGYVPKDIRALLSDAAINTQSANPAFDRIGVMPNLKAIIEREARRLAVVAAAAGTKPPLADVKV